MKLKIKNIGDYPVERLGYSFIPGETQEVIVDNDIEHLILRAPRYLEVEVIEELKQDTSTDKPLIIAEVPKIKKVKKSDTPEGE